MLAFCFLIYVLLIVAFAVRILLPTQKILAAGLLIWWALIGILAAQGFFETGEAEFPKLVPVLLITFALVLWISFGKPGRKIAMRLTQRGLIGFQGFRIGVEVFLSFMAGEGLLPTSMTWSGRNFDILTGISAPLMILLLRKKSSKALIIGWNILGLLIVTNVMVTGILSAPTPLRKLFEDHANIAIMQFPYIYLPTVFVAIAYALHFLSLRSAARGFGHERARGKAQ